MPERETTKVAIVTAAGRGMGAACAKELYLRGYKVALMSTSGAAERLAYQLDGFGMRGSVVLTEDLERLVEETVGRWGRVDAVVNSTGHPPKGPLLELSDADWHAALDLVVLNVVRISRIVTPIFLEQGEGAMVNISTFAAYEPQASFPLSASLRAALGSFAKLYADRYARDNVRMNNVLPGFVDSFPADEKIAESIPMGRYGTVEEIAKTVAFLLSADASYITGQNIRVDGSLTRSV